MEEMRQANRGQSHVIATVEENQKGYTKRQCEGAKKARTLYHALGCPTLENLKHILRQRIITNCPVTIEDVNVAADIYGPDVGTLKGKSTRPKSVPYKEDYIEIPPEILEKHSDLRLCIDLIYLDRFPMLTTIDDRIRARHCIELKGERSRSYDSLSKALDEVLRHYNAAGFQITSLCLLYTSPSPRDLSTSRMPSSA